MNDRSLSRKAPGLPSWLLIAVLFLIAVTLPRCGTGESEAPWLAELTPGAWTLDNGLRVVLQPATGEPLAAVAVCFAQGPGGGSAVEAGYSSILARLLGSEKDGSVAGDLADLGARLWIQRKHDLLILSTVVLREDAEKAAAILTGVAERPFTEQELTSARDRALAELRAAGETPEATGAATLEQILFPATAASASPESRVEALGELSPASFRRYIENLCAPGKTIVCLAGGFSLEAANNLHRRLIASKRAEATGANDETAVREPREEPRIVIVPRAGLDADVYVVRRLEAPRERGVETYYARSAVNFILNGRTTGLRLAARAGALGAPVSASLQERDWQAGHVVAASVAVTKAGEAADAAMAEIGRLLDGTVIEGERLLEQEVLDARNRLRGELLTKTETMLQRAQFAVWCSAMDFKSCSPDDHLQAVAALDKDKLLNYIDAEFHAPIAAILAIGDEAELRRQLSSLGGEIEIAGR